MWCFWGLLCINWAYCMGFYIACLICPLKAVLMVSNLLTISMFLCTAWLNGLAPEWVRQTEGTRDTERNVKKEWERCICLSEFLSVCTGWRVGGSINHSQSFIFSGSYHFTSRLGVGESRLICIVTSNCWKAVRANKIYGRIDVHIWCFFVLLEGLRINACMPFASAMMVALS